MAVSVAVGGLLVAPNRLRWLVLATGALFAASVAYAVQASGWHRLSDTLGAAFLVVTIAPLALVFLARAGLVHRSQGGRIDRRIWRALLFVGTSAIAVGGALLVLPMAFPLLTTPVGARNAFLQAALPLIGAGVTGLVLLAFGRLIEPFSLGRAEQVSRSASEDEA